MGNYQASRNGQAKTKGADASGWAIVVELLIPVLVLAIVLSRSGIDLKSVTAIVISSSYAVVGSALKTLFVDKAKPWFAKREALPEFLVGCAVNYSLIAVAVFKIFEVVTR